ncbi:MAG: response regulator transcription factor [Planctomycetes bacterium]|nr:response regulator transcription factor [Planctomycetota bacterium]
MAKTKTTKRSKAARILIVDDHAMVRVGLTHWISRQPRLKVCGEAADEAEALKQVDALSPDLVIVDISLQTGHGIDLIKRIKDRNDRVKMLVFSMYNDSLYAERSLQAGAMGYVNKQEDPETVIAAIRQVLGGDIYLSKQATNHLLYRTVGRASQSAASAIENLSTRELEVFELLGQGLTTRQIADKLHRSIHTIETHREHIKTKLKLKNSSELTRQAAQWVLENG